MNAMENLEKDAVELIASKVGAVGIAHSTTTKGVAYLRLAYNTFLRVHVLNKSVLVSMYDSEGALMEKYSWVWNNPRELNKGVHKILTIIGVI